MCAEVDSSHSTIPKSLENISDGLQDLIQKLKYKDRFKSSQVVALDTLRLVRELVSKTRWSSTKDLLDKVRTLGRVLLEAQPSETHTANVIRRVLKLVKEEYQATQKGTNLEEMDSVSLQSLSQPEVDEEYKQGIDPGTVINQIQDLIEEINLSTTNIAQQAYEHIHANEIIMTLGYSKTVLAFLTRASKKRAFKVMVAECAPTYQGQEMAAKLAEEKIDTTLILDSAIFAIMSRVNKVIIGTHSVLADGGLKALNGAHTLALAAKFHSVPVIVCAAMHKLSPEYTCYYNHDSFNKCVSPVDIMSPRDHAKMKGVKVYNPVFDYVPPDLVQLYINQKEGVAPFYVYRYLTELYHQEDYKL